MKNSQHACGAVRKLIPALIDTGVDIFNPVQLSARGMDLHELKQEFGTVLHTLPWLKMLLGSVADSWLAPGGGQRAAR